MQQHGMVLLMTLLFVFVLTALLLNSIANNLLENKLALNSQQHAIAFQAAESGLAAAAASLRGQRVVLAVIKARVTYQEKLISVNNCGKKRYNITATACYQGISVQLSARYDWLLKTNRAACKNQVGFRRLYWHDVS